MKHLPFYNWLEQVKRLMKNAGFTEYKTDFKAYTLKYFPRNAELYKGVNFEDLSWYEHYKLYLK